MEKNTSVLESLKNTELKGYLLFTDASETGQATPGDIIVLNSDTKPGVDVAVMNAGFEFYAEGNKPAEGLFWATRLERENLRYHPLKDRSMPLVGLAADHGMETRIDFFCNEKSDAAHDVARELLKLGYKVLIPPLGQLIEELFLLESTGQDGAYSARAIAQDQGEDEE